MKITKFGHSCLLIEEGNARILLDPGSYSRVPEVTGIHAILITHEHADHIVLPLLKTILEKNPAARIITHEGVGKLLDAEHISYQNIADGETVDIEGVSVTSHGVWHEIIHESIPLVRNTGFLIAGKFFYPGDKLYNPNPNVSVEVLGLPVTAPWTTMGAIIDYAKEIKPKKVIPMHDGMLRTDIPGGMRLMAKRVIEPFGIEFIDMAEGSVAEV